MTDFSSLYRKYAPDVYRFALYLSNERGEAEDITSETFVRAWTSPEPIEMATVKGYLFTIARNLFLQGLRKKSRHVPLDDDLHDRQASPYARAEQNEKLDSVLAELQRLPEASRACAAHARGGRNAIRRDRAGTGHISRGGESEDLPGSSRARWDTKCIAGPMMI